MAQNLIYPIATKGHYADFTFYVRNGQVIVRPRHNLGGKGVKTLETQEVRTRLAQLVNSWKVLRSYLHNSFSDKERTQSDFNKFIQLNFDDNSIYLTKQEARLGACVADRLIVSSGSELPSIELELVGDKRVSNICVGNLQISATTTVGEFAAAVSAANEWFDYRDDLFFLRLDQQWNNAFDVPRSSATCRRVYLEKGSEVKLFDQMGQDGMLVVERDGRRYLAFKEAEGSFGCYIHSRVMPDHHVSVSAQRLEGSNAETVDDYSSPAALLKAIESYGGINSINWFRRNSSRQPIEALLSGSTGGTGGGSTSGTTPGGGSGTGTGSDPTTPPATGGGDDDWSR